MGFQGKAPWKSLALRQGLTAATGGTCLLGEPSAKTSRPCRSFLAVKTWPDEPRH
jgi:hypothetical protein